MGVSEMAKFAAELRDDLPFLDLHHVPVHSVLDKVEIFLYNQFQQKSYVVRIIYGGGTGKLRDLVLSCLNKHPLVIDISEQPGNCIVFISSATY